MSLQVYVGLVHTFVCITFYNLHFLLFFTLCIAIDNKRLFVFIHECLPFQYIIITGYGESDLAPSGRASTRSKVVWSKVKFDGANPCPLRSTSRTRCPVTGGKLMAARKTRDWSWDGLAWTTWPDIVVSLLGKTWMKTVSSSCASVPSVIKDITQYNLRSIGAVTTDWKHRDFMQVEVARVTASVCIVPGA